MREPRPQTSPAAPWRVPIAVEEIPETGQHLDLAADAATRDEIARMAGLRDLPRLEANFDLTRESAGGVRVAGRVSASVGQTCVVTLEPLANNIEEDVDLLFMPQAGAAEPAADGEGGEEEAGAKWNDPEPLVDGVVDLGALATEFLLLGIDPYPRKPGAVFEPPADGAAEEGPFAALAGWTKGRNDH